LLFGNESSTEVHDGGRKYIKHISLKQGILIVTLYSYLCLKGHISNTSENPRKTPEYVYTYGIFVKNVREMKN
jgi:hypothetical protein